MIWVPRTQKYEEIANLCLSDKIDFKDRNNSFFQKFVPLYKDRVA